MRFFRKRNYNYKSMFQIDQKYYVRRFSDSDLNFDQQQQYFIYSNH